MKTIPLSESKPYLKDRARAHERLVRSISSSTAVDTGQAVREIEAKLKNPHPGLRRVTLA